LVAQEHEEHEEKHASGDQIFEIWIGLRPNTQMGVGVWCEYDACEEK